MNMNIERNFLSERIGEMGLFLLGYGISVCWVMPVINDGSSRSRMFLYLVFSFFLILLFIFMKERSIMWMDPKILSKIYRNSLLDHKYVGKRYYTDTIFRQNDRGPMSYFDLEHLSHVINVGQAILKKKEKLLLKNAIMSVFIDDNNDFLKNFNCSITENLNNEKNRIKSKMNFFCEKGLVKKENKDRFLSSLRFECNQVLNKDVIDFVAINNLTTSSRNGSEVIIEPGMVINGPVSKGLFYYQQKTMIFLLEGNEDYRKFISFAVLNYKYDRHNARYLLETKTEEVLRIKSENHVNNVMSSLGYDVTKYQYFGVDSGVKLLDLMIEKMYKN